MEVLIPIAKKQDTGEEVFIEDVESGLACGCICVGCGVELVANKGDVKRHYFSHAGKKIGDDVQCPFNAKRALFWMCRKVLQEKQQIALPDCEIKFPYNRNGPTLVSSAKTVEFESVVFPLDLMATYDKDVAILSIKGHQLALTLNLGSAGASGLLEPNQPYKLDSGEALSHVNVKMTQLRALVKQEKCNFRSLVENFLITSTENKQWLYHQRESALRDLQQKHAPAKPTIRPALGKIVFQPKKPTQVLHTVVRDKSEIMAEVQQRLSELVSQVETFVGLGKKTANRCQSCYFLSDTSQEACVYCGSGELTIVDLDARFLTSLKNKYECGNFARKSLQKSPKVIL